MKITNIQKVTELSKGLKDLSIHSFLALAHRIFFKEKAFLRLNAQHVTLYSIMEPVLNCMKPVKDGMMQVREI